MGSSLSRLLWPRGVTVEQKKALFARIAELLAAEQGVRKEDVFINLVEVARENWSFGNGIAQYAKRLAAAFGKAVANDAIGIKSILPTRLTVRASDAPLSRLRLSSTLAPLLREKPKTLPIRTAASVAEKADSAALLADSALADFAGADTAVGLEPVDMVAGPPSLPRSRRHAVPCQNLLAPCEIRSCFAPDFAPIQGVFWHRIRPALLPE